MTEEPEDIDVEDISDEDLAVEGFEEDSLGDEDWDELDEELENTAPDSGASSPKNKTFFQKNFNIIVISLAVIGGGFLFMSQMASPPPVNITPDENASADDLMPMPMSEMITDEEQDFTPVADVEDDQSALTPMPGATEEPLPELNFDQAAEEEEPAVFGSFNSAMEEDNESEVTEEMPGQQAALFDFGSDENVAEDTGESQDSMEEVMSPQDLAALDESLKGLDQAVEDALIAQPAVSEPQNNEELEVVQQALAEAEQKYQDMERDLNDRLSDARSEIGTLENRVKDLERQLASALRAPKEVPVVKAAPVVKAEKKAAPKVDPSTLWVLRSAQPGKAFVQSKKNSDIRTLEVGETVPGLGKITSVAVEHDVWVVRGTEGTISQQ